jgi:nicotinamidase-related amidase
MTMINPQDTALLLIGFQNDYFDPDGGLHDVIEEPDRLVSTLRSTVCLLQNLAASPILIIAAPIFFTPDYEELVEPIGLLKRIKEVGAFQIGSVRSQMVPELEPFQDRILEVPGRRGFNAFIDTELHEICQRRQIKTLVLTGANASVCIDSTGRYAQEQGYEVIILSDCTAARTAFEQEFYCDKIFPLYSVVMTSQNLLYQLQN